jgi:hypothetical protein
MVVDKAAREDTGVEDHKGPVDRGPVDRVGQVVVDMVAVLGLHNFQYYRLHSHPKNHLDPKCAKRY